jgi:hypothetical protein
MYNQVGNGAFKESVVQIIYESECPKLEIKSKKQRPKGQEATFMEISIFRILSCLSRLKIIIEAKNHKTDLFY